MEAMEVGFSYAVFEANVGPSFSDDASIARHCRGTSRRAGLDW